MGHEFTKIIAQERLIQTAEQRAALAIEKLGKGLPCYVTAVNGSLVTVAFDVNSAPWVLEPITIPKAESPWIRYPTQINDTGITVAADVYIDKISGRSTNTPKITDRPPNLSSLVFLPVSSVKTPPENQNAAVIKGPQGVILEVEGGNPKVTVSTSSIKLTFAGNSITVDSAGVTITGTKVTINGIDFSTHVHGGVITGGDATLGPM